MNAMELRTFCRVAGVFLSLGAGACTQAEQPGSSTAEPSSSGGPSSGDIPLPGPEPTTSGSTTDLVEPGTTGDASSTGTGTTGPFCGDDVIDPDLGEECDYGDDNSNVGPCTHKCLLAACGDGYIWENVEQCDKGNANSFDYGGCRPDDCTWGPRCGDGLVDPLEEECDLGELNGTGDEVEGKSTCSATCRWVGRLVFISSVTYSGALGGVSGADLKCQALAQAAGLTNAYKYRAWISDGIHSPSSRFEQIELSDVPYILRDGRIVAASFGELVQMGPRTGISLTEKGVQIFQRWVWTNTSAFGDPFSPTNHCAEWTSSDGSSISRAGRNAVEVEQGDAWDVWLSERRWTSAAGFKCYQSAHLYCFEDGLPDVIP